MYLHRMVRVRMKDDPTEHTKYSSKDPGVNESVSGG